MTPCDFNPVYTNDFISKTLNLVKDEQICRAKHNIATTLGLEDYNISLLKEIYVDYHLEVFILAAKNKFSVVKTQHLLEFLLNLLVLACQNQCSTLILVEEMEVYFKEQLKLYHSTENPEPAENAIESLKNAKLKVENNKSFKIQKSNKTSNLSTKTTNQSSKINDQDIKTSDQSKTNNQGVRYLSPSDVSICSEFILNGVISHHRLIRHIFSKGRVVSNRVNSIVIPLITVHNAALQSTSQAVSLTELRNSERSRVERMHEQCTLTSKQEEQCRMELELEQTQEREGIEENEAEMRYLTLFLGNDGLQRAVADTTSKIDVVLESRKLSILTRIAALESRLKFE